MGALPSTTAPPELRRAALPASPAVAAPLPARGGIREPASGGPDGVTSAPLGHPPGRPDPAPPRQPALGERRAGRGAVRGAGRRPCRHPKHRKGKRGFVPGPVRRGAPPPVPASALPPSRSVTKPLAISAARCPARCPKNLRAAGPLMSERSPHALFFLEPHTRRTLAIAAVVSASPASSSRIAQVRRGPPPNLTIATGPSPEEGASPTSSPFGGAAHRGGWRSATATSLAGGRQADPRGDPGRAAEPRRCRQLTPPRPWSSVVGTWDRRRAARATTHAALRSALGSDARRGRVALVRFASRAEVVLPMSQPGMSALGRGPNPRGGTKGNTDIANALRVAERELSESARGSGRIVLAPTAATPRVRRATASDVARAESRRGLVGVRARHRNRLDNRYLATPDAGRGNYEYLRDRGPSRDSSTRSS